jgi:membrane fusion protein (multidrug efflux system)
MTLVTPVCRLRLASAVFVGITLCGCKEKSTTTAAARPPVQVVAVEARRQPVSETLSLVGTLMADETVEIKSETDGTIEEIGFQEGQLVEKGHLLIKLDESKLAASVGEAEANYRLSQANFERAKQLVTEKLISLQEFDQIAATFNVTRATLELKRRQLKDARIHAPFAGAVGARAVSPGQVISKDAVLTWLVDYDPIKAEVNVPERFLSQLQVGQQIQFKVAAHADREFKGDVYFISPNVDQSSRTALVKARIPNEGLFLRPGMFANVDLTIRVRGSSVVIPEAALSQVLEGDRATIFLVDANHTAQSRKVDLGVRLAGWVEIVGGLNGGETVVVEGVQKITPGSKVRLAPAEAATPYRPEVVQPDEPAKAVGNGGGKQS